MIEAGRPRDPARRRRQTVTFDVHPGIGRVLVQASERLVVLAKDSFGIELDYSDESIRQVERIAGVLHRTMPPEEERDDDYRLKLKAYSDDLGAYIGEVMRRHHGAVWGLSHDGDASYVAMLTPRKTIIWPTGRAEKRIENGPEDYIWFYFTTMVAGY
jgi:hypothetical protein